MAKKKQEQEEQEQEQKKKGGLLKWILLLLVIAILGGGGYYAYNKFLASPNDSESQNATASTQEQKANQEGEAKYSETQMVPIEPFVVNLADPLGKRFLKIAIDLEVKNSKVAGEVEKNMPKIKDSLLLLLSSKSYSDLASMEKKILLKKEIVERLNQILGKSKILRVYFTEFVIQ